MTVPVYDYGHRLRISTAQLGEADLSLLRDVPSAGRGEVYAQMGRTHRPTAFTAYVLRDLDTVTACINSHVNARVAGAGAGSLSASESEGGKDCGGGVAEPVDGGGGQEPAAQQHEGQCQTGGDQKCAEQP
jgi:hypothetical protein